ncbi:MAG: hypothetical protein ABI114_00320 [Rhodanobacter sp.]
MEKSGICGSRIVLQSWRAVREVRARQVMLANMLRMLSNITSLIPAGGAQRCLALRRWPAAADCKRGSNTMTPRARQKNTGEKAKAKTRRECSHIRVLADEAEHAMIKAGADTAGLSVSAFLRHVGVGYPVRSIVDLRLKNGVRYTYNRLNYQGVGVGDHKSGVYRSARRARVKSD